ncbi:MAG: hypothetical protein IJ250_04895 [Bacteroidales bacterium]|nr:hypothetical protein [Bacteroidales bacterium]
MKKKIITKIAALCIAVVCAVGCSKDKKEVKFTDSQGKQQTIEIIRFDKLLFEKPLPNIEDFLKNLQKQYPQMFQTTLDDREYLSAVEQFITDAQMQQVPGIVQRCYPDLNFLQQDLTSAFARLSKQDMSVKLPEKVFSLIFGPADFSYSFENRVYTNGQYSAISLDMYSFPQLDKHPYYQHIPQYLQGTLNQRYIAPDFMRMYLKNIIYAHTADINMNPDCTLLDCIVDEGKYTYILSKIMPEYKLYEILRYTESQAKWVEDNEKTIWAYIVQNNLLYEKDRSKYMSLTAEGPTSKPLTDSPSRVGYYIGWKIVEGFMNNNHITFDSLMNIASSQTILNNSKYKPAK